MVTLSYTDQADATGVLDDEQFGSNIPEQAEFDFRYGDEFGAHMEQVAENYLLLLHVYQGQTVS